MGLDISIAYRDNNDEQPAIPTLYPEELCTGTYFRSSYNPAGFNSVMRTLLLPTYNKLFGVPPHPDEYALTIDWSATAARAVGALLRYRAHPGSKYRAHFYSARQLGKHDLVTTSDAALRHTLDEFDRQTSMLHEWENAIGAFYPKGLGNGAVSLIPGKQYNEAGLWVTTEVHPDVVKSYERQLEQLAASAKWCAAQDDPSQYVALWSY